MAVALAGSSDGVIGSQSFSNAGECLFSEEN